MKGQESIAGVEGEESVRLAVPVTPPRCVPGWAQDSVVPPPQAGAPHLAAMAA